MKPHLIAAVDFGQRNDFTALAVVDRVRQPKAQPIYRLLVLDRIRQVSYTDVCDLIADRLREKPLRGCPLVIDQTGVGAGPGDLLARRRLKPWRITITGGLHVHQDGRNLSVPKRDLVLTVDMLQDQGRLEAVPGLELWPTLTAEMENFRYKLTPTGHMTFGAAGDALDWRDSSHDDLVLAVALAVWYGEKRPRTVPRGILRQAVAPSKPPPMSGNLLTLADPRYRHVVTRSDGSTRRYPTSGDDLARVADEIRRDVKR